jgi:hypothetical protein
MPAPVIHVYDYSRNDSDMGYVGSSLIISNFLFSNQIAPKPFVCVFEVRDSHGVTQFLAWQKGTLKKDREQVASASWIPEKPGLYSFRTFAVSSFENPESVFGTGYMLLYIIEPINPISVATGSQVYDFLQSVDVVGKVFEKYSDEANVVIHLLDADGEVSQEVVPLRYNGVFFHSFASSDLDFGEHRVVAQIEGTENQTASTNFTYGIPELHGILERLATVELTDNEGRPYQIGYAAIHGNITDVLLNDIGNYSLTFNVAPSSKDGLVVQFPLSLLDKMTSLNDRDVICVIGESVTASQQIGFHGYGTSNIRITHYCPFTEGIKSVTMAAVTDAAKQV